MICITLGNNEKPAWWSKFMDSIFVDSSGNTLAVNERKVWAHMVNEELMKYGGRMQRNWTHNYFFITFRNDSNYSFFVLKFT